MDANGQRFWMLADGGQFDLAGAPAEWDPAHRWLQLASRRPVPELPDDRDAARSLADGPATAIDGFGTWATVSDDRQRVLAYGVVDEPAEIFAAPPGREVLDLAMGDDGVLHLAVGAPGGASDVVMLDRRERWAPATVSAEDFAPDRVVARRGGGAWALDRGRRRLARLAGRPLPERVFIDYAPGTVRPCEENRDPPRLLMQEVDFPDDHAILAMAASADAAVAFLLMPEAEEETALALFDGKRLQEPQRLAGAVAPFSLGWVGAGRWALLFADLPEAVVYDTRAPDAAGRLEAVGDRYPLRETRNRPFANAPLKPVHYLSFRAGEDVGRPRPLHRLSMPGLARRARIEAAAPFDSHDAGTAWHRLYVEGVLPPGTGLRVWLSAADSLSELAEAPLMAHDFGAVPLPSEEVPQGAWLPQASELPFHPGLLCCEPEAGRSGLFTALVQRPGRATRTLRGRFLQVALELFGNGQSGPQIAAIRVYAPRFSYLDRYLPALYRETLFGAEADRAGPATGSDFLQRFLGLFEGVLTPLEDKIAAAHLTTHPEAAPPQALDWLASWIGLALEPALPEARRRRMLGMATALYRRRGTLDGLAGCLDIATGGMVATGDIVVLEDFRLRRTFATILGADLADEEDPLLAGIVVSGNSFVGDTLFLGEEEKKEFLALFLPSAVETAEEAEAVAEFLDRLSYRATVLVHRELPLEELRLVRRIVATETPAHVEVRVLSASRPLLIGLSALVGVDTYLRARPAPSPVRLDHSHLGVTDVVRNLPSLDPRLE